ncbi:MAG: hypothetical protein K0V04_35590 [Deltaproteobacteria bacterium]|nr:hypothetical protein [Deltaproteobacteria bacterium]
MKDEQNKSSRRSDKLRIKDPRMKRLVQIDERDLEPLASVRGGAPNGGGGGSPGVIQEM